MEKKHKEFRDLTFADDFMFCKVMTTNENICKEVLEVILGTKISSIRYKQSQETHQITPDAKSIRLDVRIDDADDTVYDIEMQTSSQKDLAKRMRYYQSVIDVRHLEAGKKYETLPESKIIFLCLEDRFGHGRQVYRFRNTDESGLEFGDGTEKIVVNASAERNENDPRLSDLLEFVRGESPKEGLPADIEQAVSAVKRCEAWEVEYIMYMDMLERQREETREETTIGVEKLAAIMRANNKTQDEIFKTLTNAGLLRKAFKEYNVFHD